MNKGKSYQVLGAILGGLTGFFIPVTVLAGWLHLLPEKMVGKGIPEWVVYAVAVACFIPCGIAGSDICLGIAIGVVVSILSGIWGITLGVKVGVVITCAALGSLIGRKISQGTEAVEERKRLEKEHEEQAKLEVLTMIEQTLRGNEGGGNSPKE